MAEKTGDELEYDNIRRLDLKGLLEYVLAHPEYMSDSYYRGYDTVILERARELGCD